MSYLHQHTEVWLLRVERFDFQGLAGLRPPIPAWRFSRGDVAKELRGGAVQDGQTLGIVISSQQE